MQTAPWGRGHRPRVTSKESGGLTGLFTSYGAREDRNRMDRTVTSHMLS